MLPPLLCPRDACEPDDREWFADEWLLLFFLSEFFLEAAINSGLVRSIAAAMHRAMGSL